MAVLHQHAEVPSPLVNQMVAFLVSLLLQLRLSLQKKVLPLDAAYYLVKAVAGRRCPRQAKDSAKAVDGLIMHMVQDMEWRKTKSPFFDRMVDQLSQVGYRVVVVVVVDGGDCYCQGNR